MDGFATADGWRGVLEPVVERCRERYLRRYFRGDAAFASPDIYKFLEVEGYRAATGRQQFHRRRYLSMIATDLKAILEMSDGVASG